MIDLNFTGTKELEEVKFKPMPDGQYTFSIASAEVKPSKDADKAPSLKVVLQWEDNPKQTIWCWFFLDQTSEFGMAVLKDFLEKVYHEKFDQELSLDTDDLVGKQIQAIVTQEFRSDKPSIKQNVIVEYIQVPF